MNNIKEKILQEENEILRKENYVLREALRELKKTLVSRHSFPVEWNLTNKEVQITNALVTARGWLTKERLIVALKTLDEELAPTSVEPLIHKLRSKFDKLKLPIDIMTQRNMGYCMSEGGKEYLAQFKQGMTL